MNCTALPQGIPSDLTSLLQLLYCVLETSKAASAKGPAGSLAPFEVAHSTCYYSYGAPIYA